MSAAHPAVAHPDDHGAPVEHAHPGPRVYVIIAVILAVITAAELAIYNIEELGSFLAPALLVLSAAKFLTVIGFYMHLRFDNRLFTFVFGFGLLVAFSIVSALLLLFGHNPLPPNNPLNGTGAPQH